MDMFQGDLAFTVELIAIALGFYFFHLSKKENSKEIKVGAYILVVGGILTALCTGYYLTRNWLSGAYSMPSSSSRMHRSGHAMMGQMSISEKDCDALKKHMKSCSVAGGCYENTRMMSYCSKYHSLHMEK